MKNSINFNINQTSDLSSLINSFNLPDELEGNNIALDLIRSESSEFEDFEDFQTFYSSTEF